MLWYIWITINCFLPSLRCEGDKNTTDDIESAEPSIAPLIRMLSDQNQLRLDMGPDYELNKKTYNNKQKDNYEHFHPSMLDAVANATSGRRIMYSLSWTNPGAYYTNYMCHILLTTWRRAQRDMIDYYKIRDLYSGTLDYEIGYLTHVIVAKYMDTLEVIEIVRYRFFGGDVTSNRAPTQWIWYMYTNVLDNTQHIIHLCNMLNEVKKKYDLSYGETPWDQVMAPSGSGGKGGPGGGGAGGGVGGKGNEEGQQAAMTHKEFLEKQERARRKKAKEALKRYQAMMKFAVTLSQTTMTKRPRQFWIHRPGKLDYGWSIEQWWT